MTGADRRRARDAALVRAVAGGSHDALAALYDRHGDAVFAAASRLTSDRGWQKRWCKRPSWRCGTGRSTYDPALGSLAAWLHTIARNRTVDRLRAAGRRPALTPLSSVASGGRRGGGDEPDADTLDRVLAGGILVAGSVPPPSPEMRARAARAADGAPGGPRRRCPRTSASSSSWPTARTSPQTEIAERLGWPLGTVKTRTRRGASPGCARSSPADVGPGVHPLPGAGRRGRTGPLTTRIDTTTMDHDDALEALQLAAVEPGGLDRLMAGDTPQAAAAGRAPRRLRSRAPTELRAAAPGGARCCATSSGRRRRPTCASGRSRSCASRASRARDSSAADGAGPPTGGQARSRCRCARAVPRPRRGALAGSVLPWVAAIAAAVVLSVVASTLIIGARVDEQLAAQERAIAGLEAVTSATLAITADPDAERVALASTGRLRDVRDRCCSRRRPRSSSSSPTA